MATIDDQLRLLPELAEAATGKHGIEAIAAWTAYAEATRAAVNEVRALEVADLIYLNGMVPREIAAGVHALTSRTLTRQAVSEWMSRHGPREYATVVKIAGYYEIRWWPVVGTDQTRRDFARLLAEGRRIAPARWQITRDHRISPKLLWDRIGPPVPTS